MFWFDQILFFLYKFCKHQQDLLTFLLLYILHISIKHVNTFLVLTSSLSQQLLSLYMDHMKILSILLFHHNSHNSFSLKSTFSHSSHCKCLPTSLTIPLLQPSPSMVLSSKIVLLLQRNVQRYPFLILEHLLNHVLSLLSIHIYHKLLFSPYLSIPNKPSTIL